MAEDNPPILRAARKIYENGPDQLWLVFDAGEWCVESRSVVRSRPVTEKMRFAPAAMDALTAAWPGFRAETGE